MRIYLYIHTVMNTTILQLVAIYNIQLHVSATNYNTVALMTAYIYIYIYIYTVSSQM